MFNLVENEKETEAEAEDDLDSLVEVAETVDIDNNPENDPEKTITADDGEVINLDK
jgi:hypothetical protein